MRVLAIGKSSRGTNTIAPKPGKSGIVAIHRLWRVCAVFILLCSLCGCGGSGSNSASSSVLRLGPTNPSVVSGRSVLLTAYFDQGPVHPIAWSVDGGSANGTITNGGVYTAPTASGTYTVRAAFKDAPSHFQTISITVVPSVTISIALGSPATDPVVIPYSKLKLNASVLGTTDQAVTWTVIGNAANIDSSGTFTAPATPGTYRVHVRSNYDPTKTDERDITVVANANVRLKVQGKDDVVLTLATTEAPKTAANFATLVNKGFYDGIFFHRYVAAFVIQGGDPLTKTLPLTDPSIGTGGPGYSIPFESNSLLNVQYALAMAHSASKDSAGSQFYICLTDQPSLDGDYCVFGHVHSGFATVDALRVGDEIVSATTELP